MQFKIIQISGVLLTVFYAAFVIWLYLSQPQTIAEISTKATVAVGTYEVDTAKFNEGLRLFRAENYRAARDFFAAADSEKRDAKTQFYIAYSLYREGYRRVLSVSNDKTLFQQALEANNQVLNLNPNFKLDDADLKLKTPAELKAELQQGLEWDWNVLNPGNLLRERK
ncbi:MAG: hypothetical protein ABI954_01205 [Pyrinomonadaceae bacterium]